MGRDKRAYTPVQDDGVLVCRRSTLNFTGAGVSVTDDAANERTNVAISGGGGGGAPTDAQYLVLALNGDLTAERRFDPGVGLIAVDGGAGADYDLRLGFAGETRGDLIARGAAAWQRLAIGARDKVLVSDGTDPGWVYATATATSMQVKHGIPLNASGGYDLTISYSATGRQFTLTPTGASYDYWMDGVRTTQTGATSTAAHAATDGVWFLWYDRNTGLLTVSSSAFDLTPTSATCDVMVGFALLDTTTAPDQAILFDERHTALRDLAWHNSSHRAVGARRGTAGGVPSSYALNSDAIADLQLALSSETIYDEDIALASSAIAAGGPYLVMWRTGATGTWTWDATRTYPWPSDGAGAVAYNAVSGGSWTRIKASNAAGRYMVVWGVLWNAYTASERVAWFPSQTTYATLAAAQASQWSDISLGSAPSPEMVPIVRLILQCKYSFALEDVKYSVVERVFPSSGSATFSPSHAALTASTLVFTASGHTGTPSTLAGFDTLGNAAEYTPTTTRTLLGNTITEYSGAGTYSYTVPDCAWVEFDGIGPGGSGGGGAGANAGSLRHAGCGGGAGARGRKRFTAAELGGAGATVTVTIPASATGGGGGTAGNGTDGNIGGTMTIALGATVIFSWYGGGGGKGGQTGAGNQSGGSGAGTAGAGATASSTGGFPGSTATQTAIGGAGAGSTAGLDGGRAEYGGAAGGGFGSVANHAGGSSLFGGGGGGSGGYVTAATPGTSSAGGAGGVTNSYAAGGGPGGGAIQGGAGGAGVNVGDGGGGGAAHNAGTGGAGGVGGPGGGGGGGGGGTNVGGAGGNGGTGWLRVYSG